jgi:hypothetical protein
MTGLVLAGIPLAIHARRKIDESRGTLDGRGFATAALILGWLLLALAIVIVVLVVALSGDDCTRDAFGDCL